MARSDQSKSEAFAKKEATHDLAERLLDLVGRIPEPREPKNQNPSLRSRELARTGALKAAAASGTLALPPGPLGWLTIAPELYAVWKIQAQLVADIAGAYGKRDLLTREQMLYCLFSHTAAGAFQGLVIQAGERYLIRRAPLSALYAIGKKIAIRITQRSAGRMVTRWIPALGALGIAGYVYYDTGKVADTSIELFKSDVRIEGEYETDDIDEGEAEAPAPRRAARSTEVKASPRKAAPRKPAATAKKAPRKTAAKKTAPKS